MGRGVKLDLLTVWGAAGVAETRTAIELSVLTLMMGSMDWAY